MNVVKIPNKDLLLKALKSQQEQSEIVLDLWIDYEDECHEVNVYIGCYSKEVDDNKTEACLAHALKRTMPMAVDTNPNIETFAFSSVSIEEFEIFLKSSINVILPKALEQRGPNYHVLALFKDDLLKSFWIESETHYYYILWESLT